MDIRKSYKPRNDGKKDRFVLRKMDFNDWLKIKSLDLPLIKLQDHSIILQTNLRLVIIL